MPPLATGEIAIQRGVSVSLVAALIEEAYAERASDIHLDPAPSSVRVRVRTDGILADRHSLPVQVSGEVIARIKILAGLRTDEHQAAQDGRFRYPLPSGESIDVRVSIMPTFHGENAVLRLLAQAQEPHSLASLGFSDEACGKIEAALAERAGMILATGPTGSGKTTTLYTLIQHLNLPGTSIVTIEDPIEYAVEGIRQIAVNARTNLSFSSGLRALLRQDPDVIMVGEIRDAETASVAVNTALTGHLLLSTLHTTDAATTLPRLLDMGAEPYLIASTMRLAIAQRLVRRICAACRERADLPDSVLLRIPTAVLPDRPAWSRGAGCGDCKGTGYRGRVSINETLAVSDPIRELILDRSSARKMRSLAEKEGMTSMLADGMRKAAEGETSVEEVLRATHD